MRAYGDSWHVGYRSVVTTVGLFVPKQLRDEGTFGYLGRLLYDVRRYMG